MFNNAEKISNMFIFSINRLSVTNDVLWREFRLKQVGMIKFHSLLNPTVKRLIYVYIERRLKKSSYLFEAALTLDWDYYGFPSNPKDCMHNTQFREWLCR